MSRRFRYYLRVRYQECDAQHVVFNARYGAQLGQQDSSTTAGEPPATTASTRPAETLGARGTNQDQAVSRPWDADQGHLTPTTATNV